MSWSQSDVHARLEQLLEIAKLALLHEKHWIKKEVNSE